MKYNEFISSYLEGSTETVGRFARRAGVHRSTVYRAMAGDNILFSLVEKMIRAAGGSIEISAGQPACKKPLSPEVTHG